MWNSIMGPGYHNLNEEIKRTMKRSASDVVKLGYLLRQMMDQKLWAECYDCFDDYLRKELHMDYTMANRFIGINKKYSVEGGSVDIDARWEGYSQAVLIEMLNMTPELAGKVTPDMTVRQVREIKRQARKKAEAEPETGAGDTPSRTGNIPPEASEAQLPKDENLPGQVSLEEAQQALETEGFPEKDEVPDIEYHELDLGEGIATSQLEGRIKPDKQQGQYLDDFAKYILSSEWDWFGEDHKNRVMDVMTSPREMKRYLGTGNRTWYFQSGGEVRKINLFDDCVQVFENIKCGCPTWDFDWFYLAAAIQRMWNVLALEKSNERISKGQGIDTKEPQESVEDEEGMAQFDELAETKRILKKEQEILEGYLAVGGLPERTVFRQKVIVAALAAMVTDLEATEPEPVDEPIQPVLPALKNASQRKEWLKAYRDWGLWYRDDNIGAEYYKYDFDNGARLIAEVYMNEATQYCGAYEACYLHLVGGPEPPKGQQGMGKWARHEKYSRYPNSDTELVEFLKEAQRNG